ncbi:hypothetical protein [Pseudonocardia nigra]|uniref:hypothetical protein n=1 Tax=Pseudonocardia nigra TaxID=1921578 RepID=UPI001C5E0E1E|nr:hypothetical protein [Pseudonocardia nigra]
MGAESLNGDESAGVDVIVEAEDAVASDVTAQWAIDRLADVLIGTGLRLGAPAQATGDVLRIGVALTQGPGAEHLPWDGMRVPDVSESFAILRTTDGLSVVGSDPRGLAYGLLELADVAGLSEDSLAALRSVRPTSQRPATPVRSISRLFVSDVEDKSWFDDRTFWDEYLTELATHRINRLQLGLGMQYNYSHDPDVRDNYFCFAYPFLLDVPGYEVRAENVSDSERDRNLETLRFISDEAKRRGIHFQLGLWNHAYEMLDSPDPAYPITGLTPERHAEYCAAALAALLRCCPSIDGLTLRVHYEGGVPEPGHEFWRTVMAAVTTVDRPIELDMHAKGVDQGLIDVARETGSPVVVSAKYWAEHQGLPYHQASVREKEKATATPGTGLRALTAHQRRFTRYGYGDFLREDRGFDVIFRFWPGTQRLLLWGDPVFAAGYGRLGTIGGALGVELCEPLSFKGRKASGVPDGRDPYVDPALRLGRDDWKKYLYTYRLWGRLLYDPDASPSSWRRYLVSEFGASAEHVEHALGFASRVLPLITTVHGLGASNNGYWPEMYVNMPIANGARSDHYEFDTVEPTTFGGISSFDPMLFERINDYADNLLAGRCTGRYTPDETAGWLEHLAEQAEEHLQKANAQSPDTKAPGFRRMAIDVASQAGLARFFAGKNRAGLSYALYERTQDPHHLAQAVQHYQTARDAFAAVARITTGIYHPDVTFGNRLSEHGHWADRLPAIDQDLTALKSEYENAAREGVQPKTAIPTITPDTRPRLSHDPATSFFPGEDLPVEVEVDGSLRGHIVLYYRHLNQGEEYRTIDMSPTDGRYRTIIPGSYTDSSYPLAYFFTVHHESGDAWLHPGLDETLANQPYHIIRQQR